LLRLALKTSKSQRTSAEPHAGASHCDPTRRHTMKAVASLIREHQLIARLADALEVYAQQTKRGPPPEATHLGLFAAAFIDFAECIHHEKEESILLPMLARHGVRWENGALASVRREHRQETY